MARKNVVTYTQEWMSKLMEETVTLRVLSGRICTAMRSQEIAIKNKEDWDIKAALKPLIKAVPKCEIQTQLAEYFTQTLTELCKSEDPFQMHEEEEEFGRIYQILMSTEYMFNEEKLEALEVWQNDVP